MCVCVDYNDKYTNIFFINLNAINNINIFEYVIYVIYVIILHIYISYFD